MKKVLIIFSLFSYTAFATDILVGERRSFSLKIIDKDTLREKWSYNLRRENPRLWKGQASINDAKRVMYKGRIHIAVVGNSGNAVSLIDYKRKRVVYWSHTTMRHPHDVDLLPGGLLAVANSKAKGAQIELYNVEGGNNKGASFAIEHPGVHGVLWDHKKNLLWAWGARERGLKTYRLIDGRLIKHRSYPTSFDVGVGHGMAPMVISNKRYLLLGARGGILRFDTDTGKFEMLASTDKAGIYRGVKGLSFDQASWEIIFTKSWSKILSLSKPIRELPGTAIYKARFWQERLF